MFLALWDVIESAHISQRVGHGDSGVMVYSLLEISIVFNVLGVSLLKNGKFVLSTTFQLL